MEALNNNYYENCKKELFRLKREIKISKLLLNQKKNEIKEAKKTNEKLKNDNQNFVEQINKLMKQINDCNEQNKIIEESNNLKKVELEELVKKINESKLIPLEEYYEDDDEQIDYDNFKIFQRDF